MAEIMKSILLMSAAGSVFAFILLLLKPVTKRIFSPRWQYYIWLAVLLAMILPIKLPLPAKPVQITPIENTSAQTQQIAPVQTQAEPAQPEALEEIVQRPTLRIPVIPNGIVRLFGFLWPATAVPLFGYRMTKYMIFLRTIKKYSVSKCGLENIPKSLTVRKTELLDAPLIVGLMKPVLYLPQTEIKEDELNYILLHELTHYRRHDLLYKWFAMLVSIIHWFNPFVYIVLRQIDEECEVSCDYEVCKNLTEPQKKDYMAMILGFVQTSIQKKRPLTTQMASNKKILKRRFMMMKKKNTTGKFVSALSVVLALAMLSTTVFASGVLSWLTEDPYTVEITNNGEVIELVNKPFIENGEVYVPLREALERFGLMDDDRCYMIWDNGRVEFCISSHKPSSPQTLGYGDTKFISVWAVEIGRNELIYNAFDRESPESTEGFINAPVLRENVTYIPYSCFEFILYAAGLSDRNIDYSIYDINGKEISFGGFYDNAENLSKDDLENLQNEADNGHYPWRLDPQHVILEFMSKQGLPGGEIQNFAGGTTVSASYIHNNVIYDLELYRPVDQNEHGILVVKSCTKRQ